MEEVTQEIHDALTRAHENSSKTIHKGKSSSNALLVLDGYEWECPACGEKGDYASIKKPFDRGIDACPNCSTGARSCSGSGREDRRA